jgi:hypothetical protein
LLLQGDTGVSELTFISSPKRSLTHRIRQFVESRDVLSGLFLQCNYFVQSNSVSCHPDRFPSPTADSPKSLSLAASWLLSVVISDCNPLLDPAATATLED